MRILISILLLFFLCSCSWTYHLRVSNKSGKDLKVRYRFYPTDEANDHYQAGIFSKKVAIYQKRDQADSLYGYQYLTDSNEVTFTLKDQQIAIIGWGRNTTYKWLMEQKKRQSTSQDSLPPWISRYNMDRLWITSPDSQIYIREFMMDSLLRGKKKTISSLVVQGSK